ncbi:MAG: hypothetical protein V4695_11465 [Pseudomonadota bacterium]
MQVMARLVRAMFIVAGAVFDFGQCFRPAGLGALDCRFYATNDDPLLVSKSANFRTL